ncbi:MAG: hypothetical protein H6608_03295 [Flavobacteriales bacterium]|nr:hypothetical protein [Bacteroidota bacterium]MCB9240130.1 hypothetical protein [Flavobacteriales bacterium]
MSEFNRFYWLVTNVRKGISGWVKGLFARRKLLAIGLVLGVLFLLFVNRASVQPLALLIRKYALLVILTLLVFRWFWRVFRTRNFVQSILPVVLLMVFLAAVRYLGPPVHKYLGLYYYYHSIDRVELADLPQTDHERLQPLLSLKTLIDQQALSETEDATYPRFIRGVDGQYYYSSLIGPSAEYMLQRLSKNADRVIRIPANIPSPVFSKKLESEAEFDVAEQLLFSKQTHIAVRKRFNIFQYFTCQEGEPLFLQDNEGSWVQVVPIIRWAGWVFPRPVFGGVMVIHPKQNGDSYWGRVLLGRGDYIAPDDVKAHAYLSGQNLIPVKVARYIAESFRFVNGFWAPMPGYHEGDVRIPAAGRRLTDQPFVTFLDIEGGKICNYFGLEPFQEEKKGLSISVMVPGDNDDHVYYIDHRKGTTAYIGSSAINSKIIESRKNYDWFVNDPAESRPFVRTVDGSKRFFWLTTIVTRAGDQGQIIGGSIPELTLTDAVYGKVVWISSDSLVRSEQWLNQAKGELDEYWSTE